MSGVRILHFLKDWWKFIQLHQYYTELCFLNCIKLTSHSSFLNYNHSWKNTQQNFSSLPHGELLKLFYEITKFIDITFLHDSVMLTLMKEKIEESDENRLKQLFRR